MEERGSDAMQKSESLIFSKSGATLIVCAVIFLAFSVSIIAIMGWGVFDTELFALVGSGAACFWGLITAYALLLLVKENEDRKEMEDRVTRATEELAKATTQMVEIQTRMQKMEELRWQGYGKN
mgnify:CR=1 FL=1